jgi:hypothetical protein
MIDKCQITVQSGKAVMELSLLINLGRQMEVMGKEEMYI